MKNVITVCPYCASGCKISLVVDNGSIVRAEAAGGKTNQGKLCLNGLLRLGFYQRHPNPDPAAENPHDPAHTWRQAGVRLLG